MSQPFLQPLASHVLAATAVPAVGKITNLLRFCSWEELALADLLKSHEQRSLAILDH
jgi:hypothetical protein